jgi:hypothetical protein
MPILVIADLFLFSVMFHKYLTLLRRFKFEFIPANTTFLNLNPHLKAQQLTQTVFLVQLFRGVKVMLHTLIWAVHMTRILFFSKNLALLGSPTVLSARLAATWLVVKLLYVFRLLFHHLLQFVL